MRCLFLLNLIQVPGEGEQETGPGEGIPYSMHFHDLILKLHNTVGSSSY